MAIANEPKPTTSFTNSSKVSQGETWGTITTTWATETRTWLAVSQLVTNTAKASELIDSYSETNRNSSLTVPGSYSFTGHTLTNIGQIFTAPYSGSLISCKFYLKKTGSPTGTAVAKLYAITGTVGTTAKPTGSALATSGTFDITTLTTSFVLYPFSFTGSALVAGTSYAIVIEYLLGTSPTDVIDVGSDSSSPTHSGNAVYYASNAAAWFAIAGLDICFYVYGTQSSITNSVKP